jgi:hypothetical protein
MPTNREVLRRAMVAFLGAAIVIFAACGPSSADPVGGVAVAFNIAKSAGVFKQAAFVNCLTTGGATGNALTSLLGGLGQDAMAKAGVKPEEWNGAYKMSFDDIKTSETSRSGNTATVNVNVKVTTEIDAGKMRDLIKKIATTQGLVPDDATIDAGVKASFGGQLKQSVTITKDIKVVQQNGKWVACGSEFAGS